MESEAHKALVRYWGYQSFRPKQEEIITSVMNGTDTLALLPTGGGKSLCYQVPAMILEGTCLVVTPLIALMKDQVDRLKKLGIRAAAIHTGMHRSEIESVWSLFAAGKLRLLYISPERLGTDTFRHVVARVKISLLAVDEAHCVSQWGYDFRPPYLKIAEIRPLMPHVPVLALTATARSNVIDDIIDKLQFRGKQVFRNTFERSNLAYQVLNTNDKPQALMQGFLTTEGSGIVYVRSRKRTRELAEMLISRGITATWYHAGLESHERDERQRLWMSGKIRVMVATNAFGMGIDKPDVRMVVHYDLPDSLESYFQEAGRAGRDHKPAQALLLYNKRDVESARDLFRLSWPPIDRIRHIYNALGNYLQVPEGSGRDISHDFDINEFIRQYGLPIQEVYSSIKILEREGYLSYVESAGQYSRLYVRISKEELYRFMVENPRSEHLIKEILRNYGGVFVDYVNLNEKLLAKRAEIPLADLIKQLNYLHQNEVIVYVPQRRHPQLIYASERLNAKYIQLSEENYSKLKKASAERLELMIVYISEKLICRSNQLLSYFNEKSKRRCGICDICVQQNKAGVSEKLFSVVSELVKQKLVERPYPIFELVTACAPHTENVIIEVVRWMMDRDLVVRTSTDMLRWRDQMDIAFE